VKLVHLVGFITKKIATECCCACVFLSRIGFYCTNHKSFYSEFNFKLYLYTNMPKNAYSLLWLSNARAYRPFPIHVFTA